MRNMGHLNLVGDDMDECCGHNDENDLVNAKMI